MTLTILTIGAFSSTTLCTIVSGACEALRDARRASNMRRASSRSADGAYARFSACSRSLRTASLMRTSEPRISISCVSRFSTSGSATATSMRDPVAVRRHRAEPARVVFGEQRDDLGIDLGAAQVDDRQAELLGEHVGERALVEEVELDEQVAETLARRGLLGQRVTQLVLGHEAAADQQLSEWTARRPRLDRGTSDCS